MRTCPVCLSISPAKTAGASCLAVDALTVSRVPVCVCVAIDLILAAVQAGRYGGDGSEGVHSRWQVVQARADNVGRIARLLTKPPPLCRKQVWPCSLGAGARFGFRPLCGTLRTPSSVLSTLRQRAVVFTSEAVCRCRCLRVALVLLIVASVWARGCWIKGRRCYNLLGPLGCWRSHACMLAPRGLCRCLVVCTVYADCLAALLRLSFPTSHSVLLGGTAAMVCGAC
jgi:hypothetical protein